MKDFVVLNGQEEGACEWCGTASLIASLENCVICGGHGSACAVCLLAHREKHTEEEIEAFRQDLEGQDYLTPRERINEELKNQIRVLAETLCKALDDREAQVKSYEKQCRVLAAEVDRLTPVA